MKKTQALTVFLLATAGTIGTVQAPPVQAQTNTARLGADATLATDATLAADTTLAAQVSFEAKRQPLRDLVAALQKQSGVTLSVAPDAPPALVTARVKGLPLSEVMSALSRVYAVEWSKSENGYRMSAKTVSELERKLLQTGDPYWYRFDSTLRTSREAQDQADSGLAKQIYDAVGVAALRLPEGVPVSDLPEELQSQLRTRIQTESASKIFVNYLPVRQASSAELLLHLQDETQLNRPWQMQERRLGSWANDKSGLKVETLDGRLVTRLFPALAPEHHSMLSLDEIQQAAERNRKPANATPR